jgi:hypothetical protein
LDKGCDEEPEGKEHNPWQYMQDDGGEEWMLRDGYFGDRRKIVPLYSLG